MKNQKGSAIVWVISIIALLVIAGGIYFYLQPKQKAIVPVQNQVATSTEATPYIGSIIPQSARKGDTITLTGSGLNGFEGDVYFFFQRADGKIVKLPGVLSEQLNGDAKGAQTVKITLKEPCQPGQTVYGEYSGIASVCDYVELIPGVYNVYTNPWSIKSNIVQFQIIQ